MSPGDVRVTLRGPSDTHRARTGILRLARELRCDDATQRAAIRIGELLASVPLCSASASAELTVSPVEEAPRWGLRFSAEYAPAPLGPAARTALALRRLEQLADAVDVQGSDLERGAPARITCLLWSHAPFARAQLDLWTQCSCAGCRGACPGSCLIETREAISTLCVFSIAGRAPDATRGASALLESVQRDLELPFDVLLERLIAQGRGRSDAGFALVRIDRKRGKLSAAWLGRRPRCLLLGRARMPRLQRVARAGLRVIEQPWTPSTIVCLSSHPLSAAAEAERGASELRELATRLGVRRGAAGSDHRVLVLARPAAAELGRVVALTRR